MSFKEFLTEAKQTFYHGSKHTITEFSHEFASKSSGERKLIGPGVYFTTNKEDAAVYGDKVYEVVIDVTKSKLVPEKKRFTISDIKALIEMSPDAETNVTDNWGEHYPKALNDASRAIYDSYGPDGYYDMVTQVWADVYGDDDIEWLNAMVKLGYIGYMVDRTNNTKDTTFKHFALYDLSKIKSVKLIES